MKLEGAKSGVGAPSEMLADIDIIVPIRPLLWANSLSSLTFRHLQQNPRERPESSEGSPRCRVLRSGNAKLKAEDQTYEAPRKLAGRHGSPDRTHQGDDAVHHSGDYRRNPHEQGEEESPVSASGGAPGVQVLLVDSQVLQVRLVHEVLQVADKRNTADQSVDGNVGHHAGHRNSRDFSLHRAPDD
jgi:hypothetical protein